MTNPRARRSRDRYATQAYAEEIVAAYTQMAIGRITCGFEPTLLTFTFDEIGGSETAVVRTMTQEVERSYAKHLTHIFRRPATIPIVAMPLWIGSLDYPVPKGDRDHYRDLAPNEGRHFQAVALTPQHSRLRTPLADLFDDHQALFSGGDGPLWRLHAEPITQRPDYVVKYAMKAITRAQAGVGDTVLLPRTHSEMGR